MQQSETATVQGFVVPDAVRFMSFDIWNTLILANREFTRPRLALIFELLGHSDVDIEQLRDAYLETRRYFDDMSEATGDDFGFAPRLLRMAANLAIDLELPGPDALKAIQHQVGLLRSEDRFIPTLIEADLLDTFALLREQGYRLALLSNTGMDDGVVMQPVLEKLGIWQLVDTAVFSSDDGRAKPNPALFHHIVDSFGGLPYEVLHIGDNVNADFRAWEAGLESVVYAPAGNDDYPSIRSMHELLR